MTKDTKRRIDLAKSISTYNFLKWQESSHMVDAVSYFSDGDEQFMWESLLYWAATRADLENWWAAYRLDYLSATEVVGGWK